MCFEFKQQTIDELNSIKSNWPELCKEHGLSYPTVVRFAIRPNPTWDTIVSIRKAVDQFKTDHGLV